MLAKLPKFEFLRTDNVELTRKERECTFLIASSDS